MDLQMLAMKDIAKETGIRLRTIQRWKARGLLPAPTVRAGRRLWWSRAVVERWACTREATLGTNKATQHATQ